MSRLFLAENRPFSELCSQALPTNSAEEAKNQKPKPTKSKFAILRQICNWIPNHLVPKLARETKVEEDARKYKPWSHVVTLLYARLTHSLGPNDVCDALDLHSGPLSAIRGATAPTRNTPSHANRERDPAMAQKLYPRSVKTAGAAKNQIYQYQSVMDCTANSPPVSPSIGSRRRPMMVLPAQRGCRPTSKTYSLKSGPRLNGR